MSKKMLSWIGGGMAALGVIVLAVLWYLHVPILQRTVNVAQKLTLETVDTEATRELGLGGRESMPMDHGMLFVFDKPGIYPFWMKGMHFKLDIIWINQGIVQEVVPMNPPVNDYVLPDSHLPVHEADRVLEVNAGVAAQLGIRPGVKVILP